MIRNVIAFAICFLGVAGLFGGLVLAVCAPWGFAVMAAGAAAMLGGAKIGMRGEA